MNNRIGILCVVFSITVFIFVIQRRELSEANASMKGQEGRTQSPMYKRSLDSYSSKDDYDPYEYGDPRVKPRENEIVKSLRRSPRQSAKEAAKKLKRNFAVPSGEEDDE